jgi:hypothetical protein
MLNSKKQELSIAIIVDVGLKYPELTYGALCCIAEKAIDNALLSATAEAQRVSEQKVAQKAKDSDADFKAMQANMAEGY